MGGWCGVGAGLVRGWCGVGGWGWWVGLVGGVGGGNSVFSNNMP